MVRPERDSGWSAMGTAWGVLGTMFSGLIAWGGIGLLVDWLLDLRWLFLPMGMVVGMGGSIYLVVKRYGGDDWTT